VEERDVSRAVGFKKLLEMPLVEARNLIEERFPTPVLVVCD
jgi:hypothetical protein